MTETFKPVTPKDAAAMILLRDPEDPKVFWVRRSPQLSFMGGWQAFPGGQCDAADYSVRVLNCDDTQAAAMRACAIRELFEETGVLLVRGIERLGSERIASLRQELTDGRVDFAELLEREGLSIDAAMLTEAPRWVTPATSPRRYNTFFFAAWMPDCQDGPQEALVIPGELDSGEWLRPREAIEKWRRGEILAAPPVMRPIEEFVRDADGFTGRLEMAMRGERDVHFRLEFRRGFVMCSLRTPTQPPATHTNCYIIGGEELVIIDPGSPYQEEQEKLDDVVSELLTSGSRVREIIITHLHPDHIGGVNHLAEKFNLPVAAHRLTAEAIADTVRVDRLIEDNEVIELGGGDRDPDLSWRLRALWSPGHARGHLMFYEERTGSLISGDCIVGTGTVVIAPPEGNMVDYLASLERLLELPRLTALFPAHGPVLADASSKIMEYIKHRQEREAMIIDALAAKAQSIPEIVKAIYTDVPQSRHHLAEMSVLAHLEKLEAQGRVRRDGGRFALIGE
jgi:glyoxylase-like metal-dependent hydrolase (beta-lactamase superfamily II)/8-oxo-dGTP pyrophosphatase MutT (NUDIX family)